MGYGGTQSEMARLINDSGVLGGTVKVTAQTVKDVPFNKIIEAIHKTQQEIGITGTTMEEASGTIEGSTKSVKASWENLLVAIADENGDLEGSLKVFTDNVVTMAKNAVPRVLQIAKGLWSAIKETLYEFAPDLANAIVPFLEGIGDVVKNIVQFVIDHADVVINAIKMIGTSLIAVGVAKTISSWVDSVKVFATSIQSLWGLITAHPIAALVTVVTGLVAVISAFTEEESRLTEADKELTKAVDDTANKVETLAGSWVDLKEKRDEYLSGSMSEHQHLEDLYSELDGLVYQTGRVKEGYEGRVQFILNELNEALGTEYGLNNNIIGNYRDMREEIDKLMEQKRAKIILDSQEALYEEAVRNQEVAVDALTQAEQEQAEAKKALEEGEQRIIELTKQREEASRNSTTMMIQGVDDEVNALNREIELEKEAQKTRQENFDKAADAYQQADDTVREYYYNIATYSENAALFESHKYDEMTTATWEYTKALGEADDARYKQMQNDLEREQRQLEILRDLRLESGDDLYDAQIADSERRISQLQSDMDRYVATTEDELTKNKLVWGSNMSEIINLLKDNGIEFQHRGKDSVQMLADGVEQGEPIATEKAAELAQMMVEEISKAETGSYDAGNHYIAGLRSGIQDNQGEVFAAIKDLGSKMRSTLMASLEINSPSKVTKRIGTFFMEGLGIGIESEERDTLRQISDTSKHVVDTFRSGLGNGMELGEIRMPKYNTQNGVRRSITTRNAENSDMVGAFKQALAQMKIELDDEVAGKFVERTVTRVIYA